MNPQAALWFGLLLPLVNPVCAALAGVTTWALLRKSRPSDGDLLGHFLVSFGLFLALSFVALRSDYVRHWVDPRAKAVAALAGEPVNVALSRHFPAVWWAIEQSMEEKLRKGESVGAIRADVEAAQLNFLRENMHYATEAAAHEYTKGLVGVLRDLNTKDPFQCVQLVWSPPHERKESLVAKVQPAALAAYDAGAVTLLAAMRQQRDKDADRVLPRLDADTTAAYGALKAALDPVHADAIARAETRGRGAGASCSATIALLSAAQQRSGASSRAALIYLSRSR